MAASTAGVAREVPCPYCASNDKEVAVEDTITWRDPQRPLPFRFSKCKRCALVFLDPRPAVAEWNSGVKNDFYESRARKGTWVRVQTRRLLHRVFLDYPPALPAPVKSALRFLLRNRWEDYRSHHPHVMIPWAGEGKGRLIDVGSAAGDKLVKLREVGWNITGVEPSPEASKEARERHGLNVLCGTLQEQNFQPASFDAATLTSVFEHIDDPAGVLKTLHKLLVPKGVVAIDVPNFDSRMREVFGQYWTQYSYPRHLVLYTEPVLRRVVTECGFRILDLRQRCSLGLYHKAIQRCKKAGVACENLPAEKAEIYKWFAKECAPPRGELMWLLAEKC